MDKYLKLYNNKSFCVIYDMEHLNGTKCGFFARKKK